MRSELDRTSLQLQRVQGGLSAHDGASLGAWKSTIGAHQFEMLARIFESIPVAASVLDWGAGAGGTTYWLLNRGQEEVHAVELREPGLHELMRSAAGSRYSYSELLDNVRLPFPDERFDVVTSVGVLEHIEEYGGDEAASLREVHRVLRPGGLLVIVHLPNRSSWIEALSRRLGRYHHKKRWTFTQARDLLASQGFKIELERRYGMLPRNSAQRLPGPIRNSRTLSAGVDAIDWLLLLVLGRWCQNLAIVAVRT